MNLREFPDMMVRKTVEVVDGIEAMNMLGNHNIKWYDEQNSEDRKEKEDMELKESILQGVEDEKGKKRWNN